MTRRKVRRVRVMAGHAVLPCDLTERSLPVTAHASMRAGLPIAIIRTVTTSAKLRAFGQFQFATIAGLEKVQVRFIVTVEAKIVAVVLTMSHHDVGVLLRNDQDLVGIKAQYRRFVFFMATVAVEVGQVLFLADHLRVRSADRRSVCIYGVNEWDGWQVNGMSPQVQKERRRQSQKEEGESQQSEIGFSAFVHLKNDPESSRSSLAVMDQDLNFLTY